MQLSLFTVGLIGILMFAACTQSEPTRAPSPSLSIAEGPSAPGIWRPEPGVTWQWQLEELPVDQSLNVAVYDIDLFDNGRDVVAALHGAGKRVICYISAGSWEEWRPDAGNFPDSILGSAYDGWEGERWLDIRKIDELAPIIEGRLDQCQMKGFDAIEPDNIDGYDNDTGFPISYDDQLKYNRWLADEAHERGLSIGLKNDPEQAVALVSYFDWALTEDCFAEDWCDKMSPFMTSGKAVLAAEYTDTGIATEDFCDDADALGIDAILKHRNLNRFLEVC